MEKKIIPELNCCMSAYEACNNASAIIIATEWNEFRALNLSKINVCTLKPSWISMVKSVC